MRFKTVEEIEILAAGGKKLAQIMRELCAMCQPGANAAQLDKEAEDRIIKAGGKPAFKGFGTAGQEFPNTLCVSPNEMVVHGIPHKDLEFKEGDLIGLDLGMEYKGLFTDHAVTVGIGNISPEARRLLSVTKECLDLAIKQAIAGNRLGDIGYAVQARAEAEGFGVVSKLVGHGVGHEVHEEPRVPNYGKPGAGEEILEGMVLAIEPMINLGTPDVQTADDGWGIVTADGRLAAHFEHTVAITKEGPRILTI